MKSFSMDQLDLLREYAYDDELLLSLITYLDNRDPKSLEIWVELCLEEYLEMENETED